MAELKMEKRPMHRRYFALQQRVIRLSAWERRLAMWGQGWLVIAAMALAGAYFGVIAWPAAATICFGQSVLLCMLLAVNAYKWRTEFERQYTEARLIGNQ